MRFTYDSGYGERRFMPNVPEVTRTIIIINVIIFLFTLVNRKLMVGAFALYYPSSPYFHWWQYVTHMFMHGGFWHIFFNMYSLYIFGSNVENIIGSRKFLKLYFLCGFGAVALHLGATHLEMLSLVGQMSDPTLSASAQSSAAQTIAQLKVTPTLGASGAIFGILIAYAMLFPDARLMLLFPPIPMKAKTLVIVFAVIELFTGISGVADGVAHFAHLGGMLIGFIMLRFWRKRGTLFDRY